MLASVASPFKLHVKHSKIRRSWFLLEASGQELEG
jgi:hypothetical protein